MKAAIQLNAIAAEKNLPAVILGMIEPAMLYKAQSGAHEHTVYWDDINRRQGGSLNKLSPEERKKVINEVISHIAVYGYQVQSWPNKIIIGWEK